MAKKQERPGIMFYFDLRPSLKRLSLEEKGLLFESMLDYAQYGVVPELEGMIAVAWDFIQPRIDHDAERYEEISELRRKAARKRWDRQEEEPLDANADDAMQTMPTTTTTSTTKTTTTATPSSTATATTAKPKPSSSPRREEKERSELIAVAEELAFEDMRRRKLKMLSGLMAGG